MKISYQSDHLSIKQFNPIDLPNLTILTGLNGSGKTHLLEAMKIGKTSIQGVNTNQIIHFTNSSFELENESIIDSQQILNERSQIYGIMMGFSKNSFQRDMKDFSDNEIKGLLDIVSFDDTSFYKLNKSDFEVIGLNDKYEIYDRYRRNMINHVESQLNGNSPNEQYLAIKRVLFNSLSPLSMLSREEFEDLHIPYKLKNDFLVVQLGKCFADYYEKWELNEYNQYRNDRRNDSRRVLKDEEFIKHHGKRPWDVVNDIIKKFNGFDYKVNNPVDLDRGLNFQLKLISTKEEKLEINFSNLSSGERIMMALVSAIYRSQIDSQFPKVLLVDEIDASLHPSMIKTMLEVLQDVFINQNQMEIIFVTHSPSTIALAPTESIYLMNKKGEKRIEKSDKDVALGILTEGYASLTEEQSGLQINYNIGRTSNPVLFTEGITDRIILEKAWEKLKKPKRKFDIQDCFDASFLGNLFRRGEIFKNYSNRTFIALFDFDGQGYNNWNNLNDFKLIEDDPYKGLLKKHIAYKAYALLIPVPSNKIKDQVIKSGKNCHKDKSDLPIELLFYGNNSLDDKFRIEDVVGGGNIIKFNYDKTKFADEVIPTLDKEYFSNFVPLFNSINDIINS